MKLSPYKDELNGVRTWMEKESLFLILRTHLYAQPGSVVEDRPSDLPTHIAELEALSLESGHCQIMQTFP